MQQLQLPVVMCAYDNVFYILGIPIFWRSTGHAFLIDRYKTMRTKTTYVYEWVYDVLPPGGMVPIVDPRIEVVYGSPYVSNYIGMNWGWGGSYDNIWYAADGNWNAGGYDFCYERKMMTGFYYNNLP